jgi:hypothetical protein
MVDATLIETIWRKTPLDVSKANVEFIIAEYEKSKIPQVKPPQDNLLREGEIYQVENGRDGNKTFETFKSLIDYLEETSGENGWDYYDFKSNIKVYIRRKDDLEFDVAQRYTVTLK